MKYTQNLVDVLLKENIEQGLTELVQDFDTSISEMEDCMEQFRIGLNSCRDKHLYNTSVLWNYAGFVNMCAMELKIYMKSVLTSTNNWEMRTHIKTAYLLIHTFYETYDKIQNDYRRLSYHDKMGDDFINNLKKVSESIRQFRKEYLKYISIIRHKNVAHFEVDLLCHIDTMERFQLSQTIEILLKFGNVLNKIGYFLNGEIEFVISNLAVIK